MQVTIFKNVKTVTEPYYITAEKIVQRIKAGRSALLVNKIRSSEDIEEKRKLKMQLPSICFSGKFSKREDKSLIKHSGLIAIDFDHLDGRLIDLKEKLKRDKYTHILFVSPCFNSSMVRLRE